MYALSMGPHRGSDWLGRSAIGGHEARVVNERFVLRLQDPVHPRALWICLRLGADGQASCHVESFSDRARDNRSASEAWPLERTTLDPERAGLGIGECQLNSQSSQGLVRGGDFAVAWRFSFVGGTGSVPLLSRPGLYRPGWLSHKAAILAAGAAVTSGDLEVWHSLGRAADVSRMPLQGWRVSVHHVWGTGPFTRYALLDAPSFVGRDGHLSAVTFDTRLLRLKALQPQQGVMRLDDTLLHFAGHKALWGQHAAPSEDAWTVGLTGGDGGLTGIVRLPPAARRAVVVAGERLWLCPTATLEGTVAPAAGATAPLRAERVMIEVGS